MIPMTTNVNKSGGYLEVIVSEVVQLVLTRQVLDRVRVRDDSDSSRKKIRFSVLVTRYSLLVTRYSSGVVSGKFGYHLYTLPFIS